MCVGSARWWHQWILNCHQGRSVSLAPTNRVLVLVPTRRKHSGAVVTPVASSRRSTYTRVQCKNCSLCETLGAGNKHSEIADIKTTLQTNQQKSGFKKQGTSETNWGCLVNQAYETQKERKYRAALYRWEKSNNPRSCTCLKLCQLSIWVTEDNVGMKPCNQRMCLFRWNSDSQMRTDCVWLGSLTWEDAAMWCLVLTSPCCCGPCETRITTGAKVVDHRLLSGVHMFMICLIFMIWCLTTDRIRFQHCALELSSCLLHTTPHVGENTFWEEPFFCWEIRLKCRNQGAVEKYV